MMYLSAMVLALCVVVLKMYFNNLKKEYFYDAQYFWTFNGGLFLFLFFMIGTLLDFNGYIIFIRYFFPLWAIGPTLLFYGIRRLMILQIENGSNDDRVIKVFNALNDRINTLYILSVLSIGLLIFVIIDGRLQF